MTHTQPDGYLSVPPTGKGPGALVLHAWWGLNDTMKAFCKRLAERGGLPIPGEASFPLDGGCWIGSKSLTRSLTADRPIPSHRAANCEGRARAGFFPRPRR